MPSWYLSQLPSPTCGNMAKDICVSDRSHVPKSSVFKTHRLFMPWLQVAVVTCFSGIQWKEQHKTSENHWEGSLPMNQVQDCWKTAIASASSFEQSHYDMKTHHSVHVVSWQYWIWHNVWKYSIQKHVNKRSLDKTQVALSSSKNRSYQIPFLKDKYQQTDWRCL